MNDENTTPELSNDIDLSNMDLRPPLLATGLAPMKLSKIEFGTSKNGQARASLTYVTTTDLAAVDGTTRPAGAVVFDGFLLEPSGGWTAEMSQRAIAKLVQWARMTGVTLKRGQSPRELLEELAPRLVDTVQDAKIKIEPEKDGYPAKNVLELVLPKKQK